MKTFEWIVGQIRFIFKLFPVFMVTFAILFLTLGLFYYLSINK